MRPVLRVVLIRLYRLVPTSTVAGLMWSKRFLLYIVAVGVFPQVFANLWLAVSRRDLGFVYAAVVAGGEAVGASVHKFTTGVRLLNQDITVDQVLAQGFFQGVGDLFFWVPTRVLSFVTDLLLHPVVLAVFLMVTAVGTPIVFYKFWERIIVFLSSTTPAAEHYVILTALYVALIVLYSVQNGLGPDYIVSVVQQVQQLFDAWAGSQVAGNVSVNGKTG